jgi:hypothetical protein
MNSAEAQKALDKIKEMVQTDKTKWSSTLEKMSRQELIGLNIIMADAIIEMFNGAVAGILHWVKKQELAAEKYTK